MTPALPQRLTNTLCRPDASRGSLSLLKGSRIWTYLFRTHLLQQHPQAHVGVFLVGHLLLVWLEAKVGQLARGHALERAPRVPASSTSSPSPLWMLPHHLAFAGPVEKAALRHISHRLLRALHPAQLMIRVRTWPRTVTLPFWASIFFRTAASFCAPSGTTSSIDAFSAR
jgi:hypothetical protein